MEPSTTVGSRGASAGVRSPLAGRSWVLTGIDVVVGLALVVGLWLTVPVASATAQGVQWMLAAAVLLSVIMRRRYPVPAAAVALVVTAAGWWVGSTADPFLSAGACLFVVAERFGVRRFPRWLLLSGGLLLASILVVSADGVEDRFRGVLVGGIVMGAAWVLGVRTRQVSEETASRAREQERLRLSRDVHDVLSHTLGTMGVRAGVLAHVESASRDQLRAVLREVEEDARAALGELRTLLIAQRADSDDDAVLAVSLADLVADVARTADRAGVAVSVDIDERVERAPIAVRTSIHRIVQESVTNVVRHARAPSCAVTVRADGQSIVLEVVDHGCGSGGAAAGYGLTGIRERVSLLGGDFVARDTGTGFLVRAVLPLPATGAGAS